MKIHTLMLLARKVSIIFLLCTLIINNSLELLAYKKTKKNTSFKYRKSKKHKKKTMKKRSKPRFPIALISSLCTLAAIFFLRSTPEKMIKLPPGSSNLGNTCFLSATVQCLAHTPEIKKYVESGRYKKDLLKNHDKDIDPKVAPAFFRLLEQMYSSKKTYITPRKFVNTIQNNKNFGEGRFIRNKQQDAHELLNKLLDTLEESLQEKEDSSLSEQIKAYKRDHSIRCTAIQKIFGGLLKSTVACSICHTKSEKLDIYKDIQIELEFLKNKEIGSLQDYLKKGYLIKETLEGNNAWYCPVCNEKVTATKQLSFASLPPILIVQLKRYTNDGKKIKNFISFPIQAWKVPYTSVTNKPSKKTYDLIGVVNHYGSTPNSGHYKAYAKSVKNEQWYEFDDSAVTEIKTASIVTKDAYLLFYRARK